MRKLWILFILLALSFSVFADVDAKAADEVVAAAQEAAEKPEDSIGAALEGDSVSEIFENLKAYIAQNGIDILLCLLKAAAIFFIGRFVANLVANLATKVLEKGKIDPTLNKFVHNLLYAALLTFVIIAALGALRVNTGSFIAVVGAAGLAVGLALQGSLSNFAAGVMMIVFKPVRVGDYVEVGGASGTVKEITIFTTVLAGIDNVRKIIPNAQVTGSNIINYTVNGTRRVDLVMGVAYEDDIKKAKQVLLDVLKGNDKVLGDPAPFVGVLELADSSVNFAVRPWCKSEHYWDVYFEITEAAKYALEENGLTIPFPQRDVHLIQEASAS
ncbi:MAG: mechanosensitive ion channel family protein [Planctomycetota bacterium]